MKALSIVAAIVALAAALYGAFLWRSGFRPEPLPRTQDSGVVEPTPAPQASVPQAAASEPGIQHALGALVGHKALQTFFQTDKFAHRIVATVDNLGRAHAPSQLWPVNPTVGKFSVDKRGGGQAIAASNGARYLPFVTLVESVDAASAVELYVRLYPQLQKTYEDLGFPRRYFNDRVIEVIDLLLATPETEQPPEVRLTEVRGPVQPVRPWVRYEFADSRLQSLSSGQKIMLRVGPENQQRLKRKLRAIRAEVLKRSAEPQ
jgi:DUF3014 family protein